MNQDIRSCSVENDEKENLKKYFLFLRSKMAVSNNQQLVVVSVPVYYELFQPITKLYSIETLESGGHRPVVQFYLTQLLH